MIKSSAILISLGAYSVLSKPSSPTPSNSAFTLAASLISKPDSSSVDVDHGISQVFSGWQVVPHEGQLVLAPKKNSKLQVTFNGGWTWTGLVPFVLSSSAELGLPTLQKPHNISQQTIHAVNDASNGKNGLYYDDSEASILDLTWTTSLDKKTNVWYLTPNTQKHNDLLLVACIEGSHDGQPDFMPLKFKTPLEAQSTGNSKCSAVDLVLTYSSDDRDRLPRKWD
ncbi:hypothetical protein BCR37DRAFT_386148 [Protomyces lactucae-debilis]|uniref:Uncharacterized protein n=1 Tax=Protomyces lactucae-debilis TaxID=2754530 RepID=A0A1Y2FL81_PROLT|nr:uncharacterized protein BCR37DRAFT_386148 [Protomyces lactucae-debilis]ORY84761.1 hypothetical protein BCR37DRAFT_386148 [Protomyces lactucae-debilis]